MKYIIVFCIGGLIGTLSAIQNFRDKQRKLRALDKIADSK